MEANNYFLNQEAETKFNLVDNSYSQLQNIVEQAMLSGINSKITFL